MTDDIIRMTPIGKSKFVYISEPDTQFDTNGIYHCSVEFNKEEAKEETRAIREEIGKVIVEKFRKLKKDLPYRGGDTKRAPLPYKEEDGKIVIKFKSKFKPTIFDKDQNELASDVAVWKDSTMRIKYELSGYDQTIGVGCSLYLLSVQVVDLVKGSSQNGKCPFPKVESVLPAPEKTVAL